MAPSEGERFEAATPDLAPPPYYGHAFLIWIEPPRLNAVAPLPKPCTRAHG